MGIKVAIDGPSGAGKSTIAKALAAKLRYVYVDTGALYRTIGLYALRNGADTKSAAEVEPLLENISVKLKYENGAQQVYLNGENVSELIRTPEVSMAASDVSAIPAVRAFLLDLQKSIASENNVLMDGRDIGTVVLPDAEVKIFLTASAEERAKRRFEELSAKGDKSTYDEVLSDIQKRDYNDSHRDIAPLKQADDAVLVDSTSMSLEQVVEKIGEIIAEKTRKRTGIDKIKPLDKSKCKKVNPVRVFFYDILRVIVWTVFKIYYNVKFEGKENFPKKGSNIIASNHRSMADPVFVSIPARIQCSYMAKESLFRIKALNPLIRAFRAFPVTRGSGDTSVISTSVEMLEKGYNLVIFPEGTRSKDRTVLKGKTGVALIAAAAKVPVYPVAISFEGKLCFRKKVIVRFGKPIEPDEFEIKSGSPRELHAMKERIMSEISALVEKNYEQL